MCVCVCVCINWHPRTYTFTRASPPIKTRLKDHADEAEAKRRRRRRQGDWSFRKYVQGCLQKASQQVLTLLSHSPVMRDIELLLSGCACMSLHVCSAQRTHTHTWELYQHIACSEQQVPVLPVRILQIVDACITGFCCWHASQWNLDNTALWNFVPYDTGKIPWLPKSSCRSSSA